MTASAEQWALAVDPGTDGQTLANLAYVEPELWPAIVAHPNVYPALLDWMRQYGPQMEPGAEVATVAETVQAPTNAVIADASAETVAAAVDPVVPAPVTAFEREAAGPGPSISGAPAVEVDAARPRASAPRPWSALARMSGRARVISGASVVAVLVVVALVVVLVVVPRQKASSAAAASAAAAQQAHDSVVSSFTVATAACESANAVLTSAQSQAASAASTDPGAVKDPTLLDQLGAAVAAASGVAACVPPTMGTDDDTIRQQAADTSKAADAVRNAAEALQSAVGAVTSSAQAKKDDDAAAADQAAAAAAAAAAAQRTWHFASKDGFTFDVTLEIGDRVTEDTFTYTPPGEDSCGVTVTCATASLADVCPDFDPSTMIAVPVTATYTATTQGFDTPVTGDFAIGTTGSYGGADATAPDQVEVATVYGNSGPSCRGPSSYGSLPRFGVSWTDPMKAGGTGRFRFDVILQKWRTPAFPAGDMALLSYLTVVPMSSTVSGSTTTYSPDSDKVLTLDGTVTAG